MGYFNSVILLWPLGVYVLRFLKSKMKYKVQNKVSKAIILYNKWHISIKFEQFKIMSF